MLVQGWATHKLHYVHYARNSVKFRRFGPFFGEGGKRRIPRNSIVADCARVDLRARRAPRASPWRAGVETVMIVVKTQHSPMKTTDCEWAVSHHSLYCCYKNIGTQTWEMSRKGKIGRFAPFAARNFRPPPYARLRTKRASMCSLGRTFAPKDSPFAQIAFA